MFPELHQSVPPILTGYYKISKCHHFLRTAIKTHQARQVLAPAARVLIDVEVAHQHDEDNEYGDESAHP